eukprot:scaffold4899_cov377-Prasinococcus_capsulatus_cf.AAC.6
MSAGRCGVRRVQRGRQPAAMVALVPSRDGRGCCPCAHTKRGSRLDCVSLLLFGCDGGHAAPPCGVGLAKMSAFEAAG